MRVYKKRGTGFLPLLILISIVLIVCTSSGLAQAAPNPERSAAGDSSSGAITDSISDLRDQVRELQMAVVELRSDMQRTRAEASDLRRELQAIRTGNLQSMELSNTSHKMVPVSLSATSPGQSVIPSRTLESLTSTINPATISDTNQQSGASDYQTGDRQTRQTETQKGIGRSATLEEQYQLLSGKVDDQYQTKVESASKYRVRLSGIVLMNMVSNQGVVDSIDLPTVAYARSAGESGGSFGATLRQTQLGLETFGPTVAGAKTSADLQLDLAGGFPTVTNGSNFGIMRLRTATMRMDWANTSVVVGQDAIFFSPNSPTSFASLAIPALSSAGNLWGWVPHIRVEHRFALAADSSFLLQGGILDPVSGEVPGSSTYRAAGPGESSRQPAFGTRISWTRNIFGEPLRFGGGAYYNRQVYGFDRTVDGWAGMADLELPLNHQFSLSGKVYRGRALGGLYAGVGRSVLFNGDPALATTDLEPLNTVGGWAQLKYRPASKWEFNVAFGMDNPYAVDLKYFHYAQAYGDPTLAKNQGSFINMIYRPRSDVLFSAEYRHLTTYSLVDGANNAGQLNLMMGVLF